MKKTIHNCFALAASLCLSFLPVFLVPTASAQSPKASATNAAVTQKTPSLPPGVFQGSLPQTNTDTALTEAGNKAYDAILHGENLLKSGHATDAVAEFQNALVYVPDDGLAYQRLAEAYTTAGKLDQASRAFHKVLVEGFGPGVGNGVGGNADVWAEYSLVLIKTNRPAEAIQMYNRAAYLLDYEDSQYHDGNPTLKVLLPEVVLGNALPGQVQYTPEHLQALADTALAHEEIGLETGKEAIAHMKEAVTLYPTSAVTYYYLGEVLPSRTLEQKAAYQKAAELGDDRTAAAAKERLAVLR
jgi:tetratricopeptide (TPR) repeat protein